MVEDQALVIFYWREVLPAHCLLLRCPKQ